MLCKNYKRGIIKMTEDASTTFNEFISYSTWLNYADEIADYDKEMSEKMESAKRDYNAQKNIDSNKSIMVSDLENSIDVY
jgi:hypothetical protein